MRASDCGGERTTGVTAAHWGTLPELRFERNDLFGENDPIVIRARRATQLRPKGQGLRTAAKPSQMRQLPRKAGSHSHECLGGKALRHWVGRLNRGSARDCPMV